MTLSQIIEVIEKSTTVKITVRGIESKVSRNVLIDNRPLDKAIPQILSLFDIENHSEIFYTKPNPHIELLLVSEGYIPSEFSADTVFRSLTESEFLQLVTKPAEEFKTLTKEDFLFLPSVDPGGLKELKAEEFSRLPSDSSKSFKTLDGEAFSRLPRE